MQKPKLTFWQIWNMSFGFLGIQMGFALQNANVSRIFRTLGAEIDSLPILWMAAPLTGLIVQPIIGYCSDRTWSKKLGRRRPYFLFGAILASVSLLVMPNSPTLWMAAGMLWIMDASINVSMEPFRAFVGDNLPDSQRAMGFATQSFFIGIGGYVASRLPELLTIMGVNNTAPEGVIPDSVKFSFYIGGVIFLIAVLWTVVSSKEYSPEELKSYESENADKTFHGNDGDMIKLSIRQLIIGSGLFVIGLAFCGLIYKYQLKKELYALALGLFMLGGFVFMLSGYLQKSGVQKNALVDIMNDMLNMPSVMKHLAVVQFFSWFALFSMWIYTTDAITSHHYGTTDASSELYNQGANQVGTMFANYSLIAALVAFLLPVLVKYTSLKFTHFVSLCIGGIGLISIYFLESPASLEWLPMLGVGIAWASILSMPYAMLSSVLPAQKMGYFMGVFNFFIVIPQLVAASILGFLVSSLFKGEPIYALILGGSSMILAGIYTLTIKSKS